MTNNGKSIYKIRANFLKMKEHVTRTTWTTNENIIRCFVITFEYNMTILLLLKAVAITTAFHLILSTLKIYHIESAQLLFHDIHRPLFGIFLAICLHYISIKHIIFSNHSRGWFLWLGSTFLFHFFFYCFIVVWNFMKPAYNEYVDSGSQHLRNLF